MTNTSFFGPKPTNNFQLLSLLLHVSNPMSGDNTDDFLHKIISSCSRTEEQALLIIDPITTIASWMGYPPLVPLSSLVI